MTLSRYRSAPAGFTIVETLIVLAIAGIILLIVFAAIPTLIRNSTNNQRKQDVQAILATVSRYELNNSGNFPPPLAPGNNFLQYTQLHYYSNQNAGVYTQVTVVNSAIYDNVGSQYSVITINNPNVPSNQDMVLIQNHAKCSGGNATNEGASYSDIVALYSIQSGPSSYSGKCQKL